MTLNTASRYGAEFDAAANASLTDGLVTDAGNDIDQSAAIPLDVLPANAWREQGLAGGWLALEVFVQQADLDTCDFILSVSATENMAGAVSVLILHFQPAQGTGYHLRAAVTVETIRQMFPSARFIALSTEKAGGGTPHITYSARLSHLKAA